MCCMWLLTSASPLHGVACGFMNEDWELVREVIDIEAAYKRLSQTELCTAAGVDRTVLHNLAKGRGVSDAVLRRVESVLGMPRLFLHLVARHDVEAIEQTGSDPDLIRLIRQKINEANQPRDLSG